MNAEKSHRGPVALLVCAILALFAIAILQGESYRRENTRLRADREKLMQAVRQLKDESVSQTKITNQHLARLVELQEKALKPAEENSDDHSTIPSVLAGTVVDAESNSPLPGVTLTIQDFDDISGATPKCESDEAGRFRFINLPPSKDRQVELLAQKEGYRLSRTDPPLGITSFYVTLEKEKN